jgi:hypothetical protein
MSTRAKPQRVRVYTRLTAPLRDRLTGYCAASGIAERAVFEAAVQQYIDGTRDMTLLLRRLDRLDRAGARTHRALELLSEAFGVFMRMWFAHTPTLAEAVKRDARENSDSRYRQFCEHISQQFQNGRRFSHDFPHELVADDTELDAIVDNSAGSPDKGAKG